MACSWRPEHTKCTRASARSSSPVTRAGFATNSASRFVFRSPSRRRASCSLSRAPSAPLVRKPSAAILESRNPDSGFDKVAWRGREAVRGTPLRVKGNRAHATFFCSVYDDETGALTYTNAGRLKPILVRAGRTTGLEGGGTVAGL